MKRIGLVHHSILDHRGGGDLTCAWILEALKDDYDLTYITWGKPIDLAEVDSFYGTHLKESGMKVAYIPSLTALGFVNRPFRLIIALMERYMKSRKDDFDIPFSTYNEIDFGKRGIQFVQGPSRSVSGAKFYLLDYKDSKFRKMYHRFCNWFSGFRVENVTRNMTLVNSDWGAKVYKETYGDFPTITTYLPVVLKTEEVPWERRADDFLCVGDILPVKKTHESIGVIRRLREKGHDVRLRIVGDGAGEYADFVKSEAGKFPFVILEGRLNREKISRLISRSRYGIHMRDYEGFGIAIAELAYAGCLIFAPGKGGGQVEVLNRNPHLLYDGPDDAVEKIERILKDARLREQVRKEMTEHAQKLSAESFVKRIQEAVRNFN
jgi:glycosyltransferase involved in cell wall biosynthesis